MSRNTFDIIVGLILICACPFCLLAWATGHDNTIFGGAVTALTVCSCSVLAISLAEHCFIWLQSKTNDERLDLLGRTLVTVMALGTMLIIALL